MAKSRKWTIKKMRKYLDNKLHIYQQSNTQNWYARFYTEGKYKVRSLKETKFETAKQIAHDWYFDLRGKQKQGTPVHGIKFKDVIPLFIEYQKVLVMGGELSQGMAKDYAIRLNGGIRLFLGELYLQEITLQKLDEFKQHRITNDGVGHNTVKHDFVTLRQILKYCINQDHIQSLPEFPKKSKKEKPNPRTYFEIDEWKHLLSVSRNRIKTCRGTRQKYEREQLHDFMLMMVHCGTRVEETLRMTFGSVKIHPKANGSKELRFKLSGKTGVRPVRGMIGAVSAFERCCKRFPKHKKTDLLFPQNHREGLNALLKESGLKKDKYGKVRNAKSFRATFIMYRLIAKQPIKSIAINCVRTAEQ